MPFKQLANHQQDLTAELNAIAQQFGLHSLLIMESTPDTMIVFAANQQPIYHAGDAGPKSVQPGCHELYCERVVDTQSSLLVADAAVDEEWRGNEDLVKFGLIPEFVGRLPMVATLAELDEEALIQILTEPKNSLTKQYAALFDMEGAEVDFREDALVAVAKHALERKTGARGLRSILESALLDIMYELPSLENVSKVVIDENVINGSSEPMLIYENSEQQKAVPDE